VSDIRRADVDRLPLFYVSVSGLVVIIDLLVSGVCEVKALADC
jgi:hypothetical protein